MEHDTLYETEERRSLANFSFFCYCMPDDVTESPLVPAHWHNDMEVFYSEAQGILYINDMEYAVEPGDIFFINPRLIHRTYRKTHGRMNHIVFDLSLLKTAAGSNPVNVLIDDIINQKKKFTSKAEQGTELHHSILPVVQKIIAESEETVIQYGCKSCLITSLLFELLAACCKEDAFEFIDESSLYGMRYVTDIMEYINGNYSENLIVPALARKLNISATYLYRLFRDYVGFTPTNYINSVRLRAAYTLLDSGKNVTETAAAVGIPNVSYFIKLFRTATGQTPLSWIKNKKG